MFKVFDSGSRPYFAKPHTEDRYCVRVLYPESLLPELTLDSEFGDCSVRCSDLYDLFNQQRIENLGADGIRDYLSRYMPRSSQLSDALTKMSDDELLNSVKSRHIQSYSELMSWSKSVMDSISHVCDSVVDQPSEPSVSSDPSEP